MDDSPQQQDAKSSAMSPSSSSSSPQQLERQRARQTPQRQSTLQLETASRKSPVGAETPAAAADDPNSGQSGHGAFSPWSAGSEMQLGHPSAASDVSTDRVFPIRSAISVAPTSRPPFTDENSPHQPFDAEMRSSSTHRMSYRGESFVGSRHSDRSAGSPSRGDSDLSRFERHRRRAMSGPVSSIQADAARHGTSGPLDLSIDESSDSEESTAGDNTVAPRDFFQPASKVESTHVATRFTHVETEDGHAIITGRDGELQQCEDEPIHSPGAVQGFGALIVVAQVGHGHFAVRSASENSEKIIGYSPSQLFRASNFLDIFPDENRDAMLDHMDFVRDEDANPVTNGPDVFNIPLKAPKSAKNAKFWCALHTNKTHPDLIICEFEKDSDSEYPLRPADELTPDEPHDTLHANPTLEEIEESTEIKSRPLRVLQSVRKRRGEQGAMQVFDIMSQVQEQLASAPDLGMFLKVLVGIVKELTGFHRVMIYQFDAEFNGKVVTELVDTSQTVDLYKGLHFPASDIPAQARDLYKINKVRLLYDRDLPTARMVCRTKEDLDVPLDMTHAYLRAMSPIHIKYLANMAVRSSMSISINAFGELWGLISCHGYGDYGMRVSFPIRKMCRLVGDTASRNIERLSYASRLQARKLINTVPTDKNPAGYIAASSDDLLKLFDAEFGILAIKGETKILGKLDQSQEALAMVEYLRLRQQTSVMTSQDIKTDFPDLKYSPGFQVIAGLLYVPLSSGGQDFIVFFRRGQTREVKWAGNPYEKTFRKGTAGYLEPRSSFKLWKESISGKCREWNDQQVETAAVLCLVYGKFIEVWRQKEAALENSKLTRLLLANSAHEVRTPLNAIINYLEIALEGSIDQETRDNLARSHSASKSLIYVINDLLDLTKTEAGLNLIKSEMFDLQQCVKEATDPFHVDAKRKGIDYQVTNQPGVPQFVHGDSRRVRQALSNVTANAVAFTSSGSVKVETFVAEVRDGVVIIEFVVADSGLGMSTRQLDGMFRDMEQVTTEEPEPTTPDGAGEKQQSRRTLGLGLAVVARIVRTMDGQLRLQSEEGKGSRFAMQLPFRLFGDTAGSEITASASTSQGKRAIEAAPAGQKREGEILLIERSSQSNLTADAADQSSQSTRTICSRRSAESLGSQKSDADRLIDAIQTPLPLNDNQQGGYFVSRQNSLSGSSHKHPQPPQITATGVGGADVNSSPVSLRIPSPVHRSKEEPGTAEVRDSKTRIKAVKVPDAFAETSPGKPKLEKIIAISDKPGHQAQEAPTPVKKNGPADKEAHLTILVAEDDPINLKILRKRLERAGHEVHDTGNGEDCATVYKENSAKYDVVLMDMQMPIVDGLTSTKMIRETEQSNVHKGHSAMAAHNRRIPIFAVSASLIEAKKQVYIDAGFDGWILKPIDFKRLTILLTGIHDYETRKSCLYVAGEWERGGWFSLGMGEGSEGSFSSQTTPKADSEGRLVTPIAKANPDASD